VSDVASNAVRALPLFARRLTDDTLTLEVVQRLAEGSRSSDAEVPRDKFAMALKTILQAVGTVAAATALSLSKKIASSTPTNGGHAVPLPAPATKKARQEASKSLSVTPTSQRSIPLEVRMLLISLPSLLALESDLEPAETLSLLQVWIDAVPPGDYALRLLLPTLPVLRQAVATSSRPAVRKRAAVALAKAILSPAGIACGFSSYALDHLLQDLEAWEPSPKTVDPAEAGLLALSTVVHSMSEGLGGAFASRALAAAGKYLSWIESVEVDPDDTSGFGVLGQGLGVLAGLAGLRETRNACLTHALRFLTYDPFYGGGGDDVGDDEDQDMSEDGDVYSDEEDDDEEDEEEYDESWMVRKYAVDCLLAGVVDAATAAERLRLAGQVLLSRTRERDDTVRAAVVDLVGTLWSRCGSPAVVPEGENLLGAFAERLAVLAAGEDGKRRLSTAYPKTRLAALQVC
jgi:hypothetical protein